MKKWPKRSFFPEENKECSSNFEVFNDNEFLEVSNDLDDSEISLFNLLKKIETRLLYFDSPYGLAKIRRDS